MRVLHYSLGFPPYRSGGLTKFCMDLMREQVKEGHEVALLWPGAMHFFGKKTKVKNRGIVQVEEEEIYSYELIDPLPVPFDEGISDVDTFTYDCDPSVYKEFLNEYQPDIIHVHTLMGIHRAFFCCARELKIRIVFSAHDFFPICPKVTMYRKGKICDSAMTCEVCTTCNQTALGLNKIRVLQSPLYRSLKDNKLVKRLRKKHRDQYLNEVLPVSETLKVNHPEDFKNLRNYYKAMLSLVDVIHYNSTVTKSVYEQFLGNFTSVVVPISHSHIRDFREKKMFTGNELRIRYLGPYGGGKGFTMLKEALDRLWNETHSFSLDVHFTLNEEVPYLRSHGRYSSSDLKGVFSETDVLVAPSVWYETFGYTVLEALSFGVPVIITDTVGAKDIISNGCGIVITNVNQDKIYHTIKELTAEKLTSMNEKILEIQHISTIEEMSDMLLKECYFA